MQEVDLAMFAEAHADGATVIDVRDLGEYASGHVPGAQLIPLVRLPRHLADLPRDRRVYVVCASGNRSKAAAGLLARSGVDAVSVAGGTAAWRRSGKPVTLGSQP